MDNENRCVFTATLAGVLNRSVSGAEVSPEGDLILTMSDGERVNLGRVRGEDGRLTPEQIALLEQLGRELSAAAATAREALPRSGGTVTGNLTMDGRAKLRFDEPGVTLRSEGTYLNIETGAGSMNLYSVVEDDVAADFCMSGNVALCGSRLVELGEPEEPDDAATKAYVDSVAGQGGLRAASDAEVEAGTAAGVYLAPDKRDLIVERGLIGAAQDGAAYTEQEQEAIRQMLGIDWATAAKGGLIKIGTSQGIYKTVDNALAISRAQAPQVKLGTAVYYPITPSTQDHAAFYGLAKAAGVDEASSTLAMGTYTPAAQEAIQRMIGIRSVEGVGF